MVNGLAVSLYKAPPSVNSLLVKVRSLTRCLRLVTPGAVALTLSSCGPTQVDLRELKGDSWHHRRGSLGEEGTLEKERLFAEHASIYAIAANASYCKSPWRYEPIPFPTQKESWRPLEEGCTTTTYTGFGAKSWLRKRKGFKDELVIAFRGTSGPLAIDDYFFGNLTPVSPGVFANQYFEAHRYALAQAEVARVLSNNFEIVLVGHSLGGGLAEYCQRVVPNSRSVTFNTSPNTGYLLSKFAPHTEEIDWVRIYEWGEILSLLRIPASPDLGADSSPEGKGIKTCRLDAYVNFKRLPSVFSNAVTGHNMADQCAALLKIAAAGGDQAALEVITKLEARRPRADLPELNPLNTSRRAARAKLIQARDSGRLREPKSGTGAFWRYQE